MTDADSLDPRRPVLVGVGQLNQRVDEGSPPVEPVGLMAEALDLAARDCGNPAILDKVDSLRVLHVMTWRYADPGRLVADRLGIAVRHSATTVVGGNMPQSLVNRSCVDLQAGDADVIVIAGAEAGRSRKAARLGEVQPPWTTEPDGTQPDQVYGHEEALFSPHELQRGVVMPIQLYPMMENAWRAANGWSIEEHRRRLGELWAGFSAVAAANPHAWIREARTADELTTVTPSNRMVGFPYPKQLNSNDAVEQGAALILCTVEKARALGIPRDRWVFPHAGSDGHDTFHVSNRNSLCASPAIRIAGREAFDLAGVGPADLEHVDVYSCFPVAVQVAAAELGLDTTRPLTVTGGLSFAGGPWSNYVTHSVATMAERLREGSDGAMGLCTANGGYLTKHAFGIYGNRPPEGPFRWSEPQDEIDGTGRREVDEGPDGEGAVEAYTVMHGRDGAAEVGLLAALMPDGRRAWGSTREAASMSAMEHEEFVGRPVRLAPDGSATF